MKSVKLHGAKINLRGRTSVSPSLSQADSYMFVAERGEAS